MELYPIPPSILKTVGKVNEHKITCTLPGTWKINDT